MARLRAARKGYQLTMSEEDLFALMYLLREHEDAAMRFGAFEMRALLMRECSVVEGAPDNTGGLGYHRDERGHWALT